MVSRSRLSDEPTIGGAQRQRRNSWRLGLVALFATVAAAGATHAYAASTITVNCAADPNALAGALATANDGDTLAIQGTCRGTFDIAHNLTLAGSGGATLDGQRGGTVLTIDPGKTVTVDSLTITGGSGLVAGIRNSGGALAITNSSVTGNSATVGRFQNGVGGILNQFAGSVTLTNSTVSGNNAGAIVPLNTAVGGIFNACCGSSVTVTNSTVSGNSASTPGGAFGGILNSAPGSVVTLTNSTVSDNSASATGGAAAFSNAVGGISNSGGTLRLTSSTLSRNGGSEPNGGFLPPVGGVGNFFGGTLAAANSVIAAQSDGPNCVGLDPTSDAGYNVEDGSSCNFSTVNHSLPNTNPQLDPGGLKNNGGPTQTIALLPGSPAIDAIPPGTNGCGTTIATDQRGISRPQGSGCDIGAVELVLTLAVAIDIKPGDFPNPINPSSNGSIPVAILSAPGFNASSQVDTTSLEFGRTGNESSLAFCSSPQDVNGDGLPDLVCHFTTQKAGFRSGDTQGVLTGRTTGGTSIRGTDSVAIVPPA